MGLGADRRTESRVSVAARTRVERCALLLAALGLSTMTQRAVTHNYFALDDFLNLFSIVNDPPLAYVLMPYLGHLLVTRNAVFYLMFQLFGTEAAYYFWSVLLTHLLNVWLLFRLIERLTASHYLAAFGAALWGTSPLNEGSLGWYSAYGHLLVATALLLILGRAAWCRAQDAIPSRAVRGCWYVLALLAATSFGVGLAVGLALPVALRWLLMPAAWPRGFRFPLLSLVIVLPGLYVALPWLYVHGLGQVPPFPPPDYVALLSEWPDAVALGARLLAIGVAHLLLGYFFPAWSAPNVWYAILVAFVIAVGLTAYRSPGRVRWHLAAYVFFLLASYGSIAAGRGWLFARAPLVLGPTLSRYHYVAQMLLTLIVCLMLSCSHRVRRSAVGLLAGWGVWTVLAYAVYGREIDHHLEARAEVEREIAAIRSTVATSPPGAEVRIENGPSTLYPLYGVFPGRAAVFTIFFPEDTVDGRRVYFIERNASVRRRAQQGRRTRSLLVPPSR